ncbi:MAG: hypothetical protein M1836_007950 [Candelina mexicana]|nr:MAG: hypothetical protein M1836_007950 [Candelina mexicana]
MLGLSRFCLLFIACYVAAEGKVSAVQQSNSAISSSSSINIGPTPASNCILGVNDPACWEYLGITRWLRQWHESLKACPTGELIDTRNCQVAGEPWTSTFLRFAQNNTGGSGCTELNACLDNPPTSNDIVVSDPDDAARYRYVCYNIYAINFFFSSWYQGMYNAAIEAGDVVNKIVLEIDPPKKDSRVTLSNLLSALSAGLVFLVIPEAAVISGAAATLAPVFLKAIQQAPGVAKLIWPLDSTQEESIEIADLYNDLGTVVEGLGPRIERALAQVEGSDIDSFLAFASQGEFSKPRDQWINIANDTKGLLVGFTTFLVSEALLRAGWHVEVALGVNPLQMSEANATCPYWQCDCGKFLDLGCSNYDNNSQCKDSYWWYSTQMDNAYTLSKEPYYGYFRSATHNEKDPTTLMQTIFNSNWSTGSLLLENAGICVLQSSLKTSFNTPALQQLLDSRLPKLQSTISNPNFCELGQSTKGFFIDEISLGVLKLNHPNDTLYFPNISTEDSSTTKGTADWTCTSQLNLTVLQDWASVWYKHRHLT